MNKKNDWISCYIFHDISFEKVLIELIKPLMDKLDKENLIQHSFFIRYWEKGPHIRLRVLPLGNKIKIKIKKLIKSTIENYFIIINNEAIYSLEFNDYIQETERYGEDKTIKIAEHQFQASSKMVLTCINHNYDSWDYSKAISIAMQAHIVFVKKMISDIDEAKLFFNVLYKNWIQYAIKLNTKNEITPEEIIKVKGFFSSSYEKQKENINFIANKLWFEEELKDLWLIDWSLKCGETANKISTLLSLKGMVFDNAFELSEGKQTLFAIYESYVHMTNNRLGIHLRDEAFIAFLILKGLESFVKV